MSATSITIDVPNNGSVEFAGSGTTVNTLAFQHCSGDVTFSGSGLSQSAAKNGTPIVTGTIAAVTQIDVTGSAGIASLLYHGGVASTPVEVDGITATASLHALMLGGMTLNGTVDTEGTAAAQFGLIESNSSLQFSAAPSGSPAVSSLTLTTGDITDAVISSELPIRQLLTGNFTATIPYNSGTAGSAQISAPSIGIWRAAGSLSGDIDLTGTGTSDLGTLTVGGDVTGGFWNVDGGAGHVTARSIAAAVTSQIIGTLQNLKTTGDEDGSFFLGAATTINIGGNMNGGGFQLSNPFSTRGYDLSQLHVSGSIVNAYVLSVGNMNSISATGMNGTFVSAGIDSSFDFSSQPQPSDLTTPARIVSLTLRTPAAQFQTSVIAASLLGNVSLGVVVLDDSGTQFGLTADQITALRFSGSINGSTRTIVLKKSTSVTLSAQLQKAGVTTGDLQDFAINL